MKAEFGDDVADGGEEGCLIDDIEDRGRRRQTLLDVLIDLSSKTADSTKKRSLLGTYALATDLSSRRRIFAGPEVDGRLVVLEGNVGVPASVFRWKAVTTRVLKAVTLVEDSEHV